MARSDAIVLGAGIVGTTVALHLAKRGLKVALVDRGAPGRETSYGNAGLLEGNVVFPHGLPLDLATILKVALKRSIAADYHVSFLPRLLPWLFAFQAQSRPRALIESATSLRPLYAASVPEHEALAAESGASHLLQRRGWLRVYRSDAGFAGSAFERDVAAQLGITARIVDGDGVRALEPSLSSVVRHGVLWEDASFVSDPLALTQAYAARFQALGGSFANGDARTLARVGNGWRVDTATGPIEADHAVVALGPWAPDLLARFGLRLPMMFKRGYHLHFRTEGNAGLNRPILDAETGFCLAPMAQGIRLTTGAEFADRDAAPTPVQIARALPYARELLPLGAAVEETPWMGSRPCLPDSKPVIGRAPGQSGLWLTVGHGHLGLTLAGITGRILADLLTGAPPSLDPAPFRAERFF